MTAAMAAPIAQASQNWRAAWRAPSYRLLTLTG